MFPPIHMIAKDGREVMSAMIDESDGTVVLLPAAGFTLELLDAVSDEELGAFVRNVFRAEEITA